MIDWHSHVLPNVDDGSRDVAESLSLLLMQAEQGVDTVVATPHFFANDTTVQDFLEKRQASFERLKAKLPEGSPKILLGAEVKYYQGIGRLADLKALRIEGSKLLLLEMPMSNWTEYMIRELSEIASGNSVKIVLAHIERYAALQKRSARERLLENGILMQSNAGFFASFSSKRKALSLLREGSIQLIGSDCHNTTSRPPRIGKAFEIIQKKLGEDYVCQMNEYGRSVLAAINH